MPTRTKADLEVEIKALKCQLEKMKQIEQYDKCANELYRLYVSFVDAGFNEKQAYELTRNIVNNGTAPTPKYSMF